MHAPWIQNAVLRWRHRQFVRRHLAVRHPALREALRGASPDCVLLAGNSHAEFIGTPDFGGRRCVNVAVGGSTAADCAKHLAGLQAPVRVAASVLMIGTNDIVRWRHPGRIGAERRFEADVRRILSILEAWSAQVFVAAVPPIGAAAKGRDPAAVATFSARLAALCAEAGHTFFDPFAALLGGGPGLASGAFHRDGVHLADYAGLAAEVIRLVVVDPAPPGLRTTRDTPGPTAGMPPVTAGAVEATPLGARP